MVVGKIDTKCDLAPDDIHDRQDLVVQSHRIPNREFEPQFTHDKLLAWLIGAGQTNILFCPADYNNPRRCA